MTRLNPSCGDDERFIADPPTTRPERVELHAELSDICRACPLFFDCGAQARRELPVAGFWAGHWWAEPIGASRRRDPRFWREGSISAGGAYA